MKCRQNGKSKHQTRQPDKRDCEDTDPYDSAAVARGHRALVGRPKMDGQRVQDQSESEPDQQRVFDADFLIGLHDELKERPIEQQPEHEHGRRDVEKRKERVDLPKREEPEGSVAPQHQKLSVRDV